MQARGAIGRIRRRRIPIPAAAVGRLESADDAAATSDSVPSAVPATTPEDDGRSRSVLPGDPALDLPKGPPKILIADDNLQNVELLEAYLSDVDCEIRTAVDGEETLRGRRRVRAPTCSCST